MSIQGQRPSFPRCFCRTTARSGAMAASCSAIRRHPRPTSRAAAAAAACSVTAAKTACLAKAVSGVQVEEATAAPSKIASPDTTPPRARSVAAVVAPATSTVRGLPAATAAAAAATTGPRDLVPGRRGALAVAQVAVADRATRTLLTTPSEAVVAPGLAAGFSSVTVASCLLSARRSFLATQPQAVRRGGVAVRGKAMAAASFWRAAAHWY